MLKLISFLAGIWLVSSELISNVNVVTYMEINNHLVSALHRITFSNEDTTPAKWYTFIEESKNHLSGCYDQFENKLSHRETPDNDTLTRYIITFRDEVKPKEVSVMSCYVLLVDKLRAHSKTISLKEQSLVVFETNILFFSIYETALHRLYLVFEIPSEEVYTEDENVQRKDNVLSFNASNLQPFSFKANKFIFVYDKPMFIIKSLNRNIHLSIFGKIFIEDNVVIQNRANRILGDFYNVYFLSNVPKMFSTYLPASAEDIKFFDILGNNSKSTVIHSTDDVTLIHRPRYPLLGGWQYTYTVQYYVPIYEYVFTDDHGSFYLQMRAIDHIISNTFIEEAVTRVSLPEFSTVIKVTVPEKFSRRPNEISHDKLSFQGNPTVVFNGSYLIANDIYPFMIKFSYKKYLALSYVVLLTMYIQSIFVLYLICKKIFL